MLEQFNAYAPLIAALAALVSAVAAVAVARLSIGTWRLYELEKKRDRSRHRRVESVLMRVLPRLVSLQSLATIGQEEERWRNFGVPTAELLTSELSWIEHELTELTGSTVRAPVEVRACIDTAFEHLGRTKVVAAALLSYLQAGRTFEFLLPVLEETLGEIEGNLAAALVAIPPEARHIGERGEEYSDLVSRTDHLVEAVFASQEAETDGGPED